LSALSDAVLGRSHRAPLGKSRLKEAIDRTRTVLGVPDDYLIGIVPASDTGAFELAMWSVLGCRPVDVLAWESFGSGWAGDIKNQLKLSDVRLFEAPYGELPDLNQVNPAHDIVFTWNGTTSGVRVPDGDWIASDRTGLTLCDATSAAFAMDLPWEKLDMTTFSWQKALGGEGQHGMLILSPRAVKRLENYTPPWPLPKIFRLTKGGKVNLGIFEGSTINTPSMLCVEDYVDALKWAEGEGGLKGLIDRTNANAGAIENWVKETPWIDYLATDEALRSTTSVCLKITAPWVEALSADEQSAFAKSLAKMLADEGAAHDIGGYRDAPSGLRLWAGATIETKNLNDLFPWLDWAYGELKQQYFVGSKKHG
jgi:phosphoserine aminotransferase